MNRFDKNRIIKISSLFLIVVIGFGLLIWNSNSKNDKELNNITKKSSIDRSKFAIMLEQQNGSYLESDIDTWPMDGYYFDIDLSNCVDNNGNKLENILTYNSETQAVTLTSNKTAYCYLYFSYPADVTIRLDGTTGTNLIGKYEKSIDCGDAAEATYNVKYNRVEFSGITAMAECMLTYTKDTNNYTTLNDTVISLGKEFAPDGVDQLGGEVVHEIARVETTLEKADYGTPKKFKAESATATTGTSYGNIYYSTEASQWVMDFGAHEIGNSEYFFHFLTSDLSAGKYEVCYTIGTGPTNGKFHIYNTETLINTISVSDTTEINECIDIGYVDEDGFIHIVQEGGFKAYGNSSGGISFEYPNNTTFYLNKVDESDAGYRYEGKNPDNYVWFNNELWRIIGSVPTKVHEDGTTENLIKIIRSQPIGVYAYDNVYNKETGFNGVWGQNALSSLLNTHYYASSYENMNGNSHSGCYFEYSDSRQTKGNCDFRRRGILSSGYYGQMVENVFWSTASVPFSATAFESYFDEISEQNFRGRIGLLSVTDFGLATDTDYRDFNMYELSEKMHVNWMFNGGTGWTISTIYSDSDDAITLLCEKCVVFYINNEFVSPFGAFAGYVQPVLYLKSDVYVIDGSGKATDPFIIAL